MLEEWALKYEDEFMDETVGLESSPLLTCLPQCTACAMPQATFRCIDCFAESLFCQECLLLSHRREPFHYLQVVPVLKLMHDDSLLSSSVGSSRISRVFHSRSSVPSSTLVTTTETRVLSHRPPSSSLCSTLLVSTLSPLPTVNVILLAPAPHHESNCYALVGSLPPGSDRVPPFRFASSISCTSFDQPAKSICMTSTAPLLPYLITLGSTSHW